MTGDRFQVSGVRSVKILERRGDDYESGDGEHYQVYS